MPPRPTKGALLPNLGAPAIFAAVADELAAVQDEIAAAATLDTAEGEFASAKDSAEAALAALRQWVMDAEASKDDEAGE